MHGRRSVCLTHGLGSMKESLPATCNFQFSEVRVNENSVQQERRSDPCCSLVYFSFNLFIFSPRNNLEVFLLDLVGIPIAF